MTRSADTVIFPERMIPPVCKNALGWAVLRWAKNNGGFHKCGELVTSRLFCNDSSLNAKVEIKSPEKDEE